MDGARTAGVGTRVAALAVAASGRGGWRACETNRSGSGGRSTYGHGRSRSERDYSGICVRRARAGGSRMVRACTPERVRPELRPRWPESVREQLQWQRGPERVRLERACCRSAHGRSRSVRDRSRACSDGLDVCGAGRSQHVVLSHVMCSTNTTINRRAET